MSKKTGGEIEADIYKLINESTLSSNIGGHVYKEGTRPPNATSEDIVVSFFTGIDDFEMQEGYVNVNIYVPDIDNSGDTGELVKDIARCRALEILALGVFSANTIYSNYILNLSATIKTFNIEEIEISQHFVNCKVHYRLSTL